jgi:hypothetical protein
VGVAQPESSSVVESVVVATYFEGFRIEPSPRISAHGWFVRTIIADEHQEVVCEDGTEYPTYEEATEAGVDLGRRWIWRRRPALKL